MTPDAEPSRPRLGIMGGTFDPIHQGHLVVASEVQQACDLQSVTFVPAGQPWQKSHSAVSPAEQRYLMTVLATASNPNFLVSRVDIERPGPTFTIDTLRDLRAEHPDADLHFITGADALSHILTWKDVDELFTLARFIAVTRPGHEIDLHALVHHGLPADRLQLLEIPAMAISSTACRERVRAGGSVRYLVPDGVAQFISTYGLYSGGKAADWQ
jgi:nicotinate-nucleotide adenylyltransferase